MQAKKLVNLSTAKKVLYKIGYNKIFDPVVWKAKDLFHNQKITKDLGRVIMVKSHRLSGSGYPKNQIILRRMKRILSQNHHGPQLLHG